MEEKKEITLDEIYIELCENDLEKRLLEIVLSNKKLKIEEIIDKLIESEEND